MQLPEVTDKANVVFVFQRCPHIFGSASHTRTTKVATTLGFTAPVFLTINLTSFAVTITTQCLNIAAMRQNFRLLCR